MLSCSVVLTLCDPMDCSPPASSVHGILQQKYWSGLSFLTPGDLPNPRVKPTSPAFAGIFFSTALCGKSYILQQLFFKSCQFRARDGTFIMTSNPKILLPKMLKLPFFLVNEMLFDDCTVMRVYTHLSSKESKTILETRFSFNSGIFIHCITKNVSVSLTMHVFPEGRDIVWFSGVFSAY